MKTTGRGGWCKTWEPRPWCRPERHAGNLGPSTASCMPAATKWHACSAGSSGIAAWGPRYDKLDVMFAGFIYLALVYEMIRNLV